MQQTFARRIRLAAVLAPTLLVFVPGALRAQNDQPSQAGTASAAVMPSTTAREDKGVLRICGDPDNLPFSNEKLEGFENKIATLIAKDLGDSVVYLWWPHRRGFVRNTLRAHECDILMGVPKGFDPVLSTKPYYRSTYYVVTRQDRNLHITTLNDPQLKTLKIGVNLIGYDYTNTPPAEALAARGISTKQVKGYSTFYGQDHSPGDIIDGVVKGEVDVALVWGPLAGYFAKRAPVPLTLVALPDSDSTGLPFAYEITMGVRRSDKEFKAKVEEALDRHRLEIEQILRDYNVPTVPSK